VFDFYQFWLNQPDSAVEYLLKIYTVLDKPEIERIMAEQEAAPEKRIAQKALAQGVTEVVHGKEATEAVCELTGRLFAGGLEELTEAEIAKNIWQRRLAGQGCLMRWLRLSYAPARAKHGN
jgi:tyrosyl-tRNA synthetase